MMIGGLDMISPLEKNTQMMINVGNAGGAHGNSDI